MGVVMVTWEMVIKLYPTGVTTREISDIIEKKCIHTALGLHQNDVSC